MGLHQRIGEYTCRCIGFACRSCSRAKPDTRTTTSDAAPQSARTRLKKLIESTRHLSVKIALDWQSRLSTFAHLLYARSRNAGMDPTTERNVAGPEECDDVVIPRSDLAMQHQKRSRFRRRNGLDRSVSRDLHCRGAPKPSLLGSSCLASSPAVGHSRSPGRSHRHAKPRSTATCEPLCVRCTR